MSLDAAILSFLKIKSSIKWMLAPKSHKPRSIPLMEQEIVERLRSFIFFGILHLKNASFIEPSLSLQNVIKKFHVLRHLFQHVRP